MVDCLHPGYGLAAKSLFGGRRNVGSVIDGLVNIVADVFESERWAGRTRVGLMYVRRQRHNLRYSTVCSPAHCCDFGPVVPECLGAVQLGTRRDR